MIVLDASVLIAHLGGTDALHRRATDLLLDAVDIPLAASPLTLAEVYVGPARAGKLSTARAAVRSLQVQTVPLDEDAPTRLGELRAATKLPLPDCCVLLAGETVRGAIATFDDRLASSAIDLGLAVRS